MHSLVSDRQRLADVAKIWLDFCRRFAHRSMAMLLSIPEE
jgi:hypothetical protein